MNLPLRPDPHDTELGEVLVEDELWKAIAGVRLHRGDIVRIADGKESAVVVLDVEVGVDLLAVCRLGCVPVEVPDIEGLEAGVLGSLLRSGRTDGGGGDSEDREEVGELHSVGVFG